MSLSSFLASLFTRTPSLVDQAEAATTLPPSPAVPVVVVPTVKPAPAPAAAKAPSPTTYDPLTTLQRKTAQAIIQVFETGRYSPGSYGSVSNAAGDAGGLSYGSHQVSLTSGNLYLLLRNYCDQGGACASRLQPYMSRIANKERAVGASAQLQAVLREAGSDPIMKRVQDEYFDANFWRPSARDAQARKFVTPLAYALVFDGHIQGGWGKLAPRVSTKLAEREWCREYIRVRRAWLLAGHGIVPKTVYRMDTFSDLVKLGNWDLDLPLKAHGVTITRQMLEA
jgi:chitosanase